MQITYKKWGNKYYKQGKKIELKQLKKELNSDQISKLNTDKICNIRVKEHIILTKADLAGDLSPENRKIVEENRSLYKIENENYKGQPKLGMWRKNKYGYYNFACYLEDREDVDLAILKDVASTMEEN